MMTPGKPAPPASRTAVLLVGNYRPTLAIARALEPLGHPIIVAGQGGEGAAEASRHVREIVAMADGRHGANPVWLSDPCSLSDLDIGMVMPVTEEASRQIAECQELASRDVTWIMPAAETVLTCLDKPAMYARCQALGIPTEPFAETERQHLSQAVASVGTPCVVRPEDSTRRIGDEKAVFIDTPAALDHSALNALPRRQRLIVQRKATGIRHNLYFAAAQGRLIAMCEARIARTDRRDGTGLAVEGVTLAPNADLVRWTETLTRSLDYTGIGCAQFLVDAHSGQYAFLEINPRVPGNHAIAEAAGLPLARLAVELATDAYELAPLIVGRPGLRFAWTYGDLRGLRAAMRGGDLALGDGLSWLGKAASAAVQADLHMTWSRRDPRPTLTLYARQLGLGRLTSGRHATLALGGVSRT